MELPVLAGRSEIVRRYGHLLHHFGAELGRRPLVMQTAEFFPDPFSKDLPSLERLVRRLQTHAGIADIPVGVQLLGAAGPVASGCGSGGCAPKTLGDGPELTRLVESGNGWTLNVLAGELHHPVALTANLSRALGHIFLSETRSEAAPVEQPLEVSVDLAAVGLGLGLLAFEGSYIYAKSCGGPSVTTLTALSVGEMAIACALFLAAGGHSPRRARAELGTTQRTLLAEAGDWVASNPKLIERLRHAPAELAERAPELSEAKPWLLRVLDRPRRTSEPSLERALSGGLGDAELLALARAAQGEGKVKGEARLAQSTSPAAARRRELSALVSEALDETAASPLDEPSAS